MSYELNSNPLFDSAALSDGDTSLPFAGEALQGSDVSDYAIDAALRGISLPEGMLTRLGKLAFAEPDETLDQMDYLGC